MRRSGNVHGSINMVYARLCTHIGKLEHEYRKKPRMQWKDQWKYKRKVHMKRYRLKIMQTFTNYKLAPYMKGIFIFTKDKRSYQKYSYEMA